MSIKMSDYGFTEAHIVYDDEVLWAINKLPKAIEEITTKELTITSFTLYFAKKDEEGVHVPMWFDFWEVDANTPLAYFTDLFSNLSWSESTRADVVKKLFRGTPYYKGNDQLANEAAVELVWAEELYVGVTMEE